MQINKIWIALAVVAFIVPIGFAIAQDGSGSIQGQNPFKAAEPGACGGSCNGGACAQPAAQQCQDGSCQSKCEGGECNGQCEDGECSGQCDSGCEKPANAQARDGECGDCGERGDCGDCGGSGCCGDCEAIDNGAETMFIAIDGMCCNGCVGKVTKALEALAAVKEVRVDRAAGLAVIHRACAATCTLDKVVAAVKEAGYEAQIIPATTRVFHVDAIHCGNCANAVKTAFAGIDGVLEVRVNNDTKDATVTFDPRATDCCALETGLAKATEEKFTGELVVENVRLAITGMTCNGCVDSVERALDAIEGVSAVVDLETNTAEIVIEKGATTVEALIAAIKAAGFEATVAE